MALLPLIFAAAVAAGGATLAAESAAYEARLLEDLATLAPNAVGDARAASEAYVAGRWKEALEGYERVEAAAPGWSHAVRRECSALRELGQRKDAIARCRRALSLAPLPENGMALAVTLSDRRAGSPGELAEAARIATGVLASRPKDFPLATSACRVALQANDAGLLDACARRLTAIDPEDPATLAYASIAAVSSNRLQEATALVARARRAGVDPGLLSGIESAIEEQRGPWERWGAPAVKIAAGWAAGLALLVALAGVLSAATVAATRRLAAAGAAGGSVDVGSGRLRRLYRSVLWGCCAYYYLSIPLVLVGVVAGGGAALYGFLALGRVPVKLVLLLAIVVIMTVWAVMKSLWVSVFRPKDSDPGERIARDAHPALTALIDGVAAKVGTRPVDTVFMTPGTEMAVFERGSVLRQLSGKSERCLIMGIGLFDGMKQGELKGILAHEYGHFVNEDTAGGGLAIAVRRSLLEMGRTLAAGGAATWYNPAWWFVTGFYKVFLRISQGASRLQEVLADRWAALAFGGKAFASGMRHVVARSIRFETHAQRTLREVIDGQRPLANLYRYEPKPPADGEPAPSLDAEIEQALQRPPSPYDSHPRPADRIAWVERIEAPRSIDDDAPVWDLFRDREEVERRMTHEVRESVARNHGVHIPAEEDAAPA